MADWQSIRAVPDSLVVVMSTWRGDEIHFRDYDTYRRAFDLCKVRCRTLLQLIRQLKVFDVRPECDPWKATT